MACQACRAAKVKCVKNHPSDKVCKRCEKNNIPCVPHVSKQGQGPKPRGTKKRLRVDGLAGLAQAAATLSSSSEIVSSSPASLDASLKPSKVPKQKKVQSISTEATIFKETKGLPKNHYGVYHHLRSWVAIAMRRRTFHLLGNACNLANQCGISMDDLISGSPRYPETNPSNGIVKVGEAKSMFYLPYVILKSKEEQTSLGPRLPIQDLPMTLFQAMDYSNAMVTGTIKASLGQWDHRRIVVRETKNGLVRWGVTPAFERDICPYKMIEKTWHENIREVIHVWLPDRSSRDQHSKLVVRQIAQNDTPYFKPKPMRQSNCHLRTITGEELEVDVVVCMVMPDLDTVIYCTEYIFPQQSNAKPIAGAPFPGCDDVLLMSCFDGMVDDDLEQLLLSSGM